MRIKTLTAIFVILVLILSLAGCGGQKIITVDLADYVEVEVSGRNGAGTAEYFFDSYAAKSDIFDMQVEGEALENEESFGKAFQLDIALSQLMSTVEVTASQTEDLSNGDIIEFEVEYDKEIAKDMKIKFKTDVEPVTVTDLEEVQIIDIFDYVTVEFTGSSPYLKPKAELSPDNPVYKNNPWSTVVRLSCSHEVAQNGDVVTITAEYDKEAMANDKFIQFETDSREYTVDSKTEYLLNQEDLDKEAFETLNKEAIDKMTSYLIRNKSHVYWAIPDKGFPSSMSKIPEIQLVNAPVVTDAYIQLLKPGLSWSLGDRLNRLIMVYEITAFYPAAPEIQHKLYFALHVDNVLIEDGKVKIDLNSLELSELHMNSQELHNKYVGAYIDRYSFNEFAKPIF